MTDKTPEYWLCRARRAEQIAERAVAGKPVEDALATANLRVWQNVAAQFYDKYREAVLKENRT